MDSGGAPNKRRRMSRSDFSSSQQSSASETDVIDLTGDSPEPYANHKDIMGDDEAFARRLQAQYDSEISRRQPHTRSGAAQGKTTGGSHRHRNRIPADESLAQPTQTGRNKGSHRNEQSIAPTASKSASKGRSSTRASRTDIGEQADAMISLHVSPQDVQKRVRNYYRSIAMRQCPACSNRIFASERSILVIFDALMARSGEVPQNMPCTTCRSPSGLLSDPTVLVWVTLSGFDHKSKYNRVDTHTESMNATKARHEKATSGTGYGGHDTYAEAYSSLALSPGAALWPGPPSIPAATMKAAQWAMPDSRPTLPLRPAARIGASFEGDDSTTEKTLGVLTSLLTAISKQHRGTPVPPELFLASSMLDRAADLLRNNDLEDVTNRAKLYDNLVRLIRILASDPTLGDLVFRERVVRAPGASLLQISLGNTDLVSSARSDTSQSLVCCMKDLVTQCSTMLRNTEARQYHQALFHAVVDLGDFLKTSVSAQLPAINEKRLWQKELAVLEVADSQIISRHSLTKQGLPTHSQPGRMTRIMQELARLQTLPKGVFVRYASSRPDIMKALITGPKDTPYENGLFEFDILCGTNFPKEPPEMSFRTTAGGGVSFNPNLYADGKVCLSLLGTWSGEPWDPKRSTLLQVLVSIQAMIFCEFPWRNEPGREKLSQTDPQCQVYNRSLYPHTVQYAMLDWLDRRQYGVPKLHRGFDSFEACASARHEKNRAIDNGNGLWDDVVTLHFESCETEILETVKRWVSETRANAPTTQSRSWGSGWSMPLPDWTSGSQVPSFGLGPIQPLSPTATPFTPSHSTTSPQPLYTQGHSAFQALHAQKQAVLGSLPSSFAYPPYSAPLQPLASASQSPPSGKLTLPSLSAGPPASTGRQKAASQTTSHKEGKAAELHGPDLATKLRQATGIMRRNNIGLTPFLDDDWL